MNIDGLRSHSVIIKNYAGHRPLRFSFSQMSISTLVELAYILVIKVVLDAKEHADQMGR